MNDEIRPSEIFPSRLKAARESRDLSQADLGKRALLPASSISHFESGARKPSFDNLRRLANALDVTTDYLLGRVSDTQTVGAAEKIHRHLNALSQTDLDLADNFLNMLAQRNKKPGS